MSTAAIAVPGARRHPRTVVVVLQAAAILLVSVAGGGVAHLVLRAEQTQAVVEQTGVRQERLAHLETVVLEEDTQLEELERGLEELRAKLADRSGLL